MKDKFSDIFNASIIVMMPIMIYMNVFSTKVNLSMSDTLLIIMGLYILFNAKKSLILSYYFIFLYFITLIVSLIISQFVGNLNTHFITASNKVMILEIIKTIIISVYFIYSFIYIKSKREYTIALTFLSLSAIPVIVIGFTSYFYFSIGKTFFISEFIIKHPRFLGTFEDPNLCAFYLIIILFISLLNFSTSTNIFKKIVMVLISTLSIMTIILTMSRGGWLALFIGLITLILINLHNLKKEHILIILMLLTSFSLFINLDFALQDGKIVHLMETRIQNSLMSGISEIDRFKLTKAAIEMGNDNFIFGVGKGSFSYNSYKYLGLDSPNYIQKHIPHNTIAGFYAQQGIVGVTVFLSLIIYIGYLLFKSKRSHNTYLIALCAALLTQSMTINIENVRFFWYLLAVILAGELLDINFEKKEAYVMSNKSFLITLISLLILLTASSTSAVLNIIQ